MKNIQRKWSSAKIFILLVGLVVLGVVAYIFAIRPDSPFRQSDITPNSTTTSVNYSPPSKKDVESGITTKEQVAEKNKSDTTTHSGAVQITSATSSDGTYYIRTLIDSVTSSGTCSLLLTHSGGAQYAATSDIQAMASTSTCKGFNIPLTSLKSGAWTVRVTVERPGLNTISVEKEVTIE